MNIKKLIKEAHENAKSHGFYDCPECRNPSVSCVGAGQCDHDGMGCNPNNNCGEYEPICQHCNGSGIDPNKNIGELLMLIISELGEALEAHRCNRFAKLDSFENCKKSNDIFNKDKPFYIINSFERLIKNTFEDEIADVFIRLFDLCGYLGIEIKTYPKLEMTCFKNIGQELLWWTATLSNLPSFIEYYEEIDDITVEIEQISLIVKRIKYRVNEIMAI